MYTNIPKNGNIHIINNVLENNPDITMNIQKEILYILQTVIEQHYFQFHQQYWITENTDAEEGRQCMKM